MISSLLRKSSCLAKGFGSVEAFHLAKAFRLASSGYAAFVSGVSSIWLVASSFMPSASFVLSLPTLLGKLRRFLFFLVAAGFLSVVLMACGGGGSGGSSSSGGNGGGDPGGGDNGPGGGSSSSFKVKLTFAPIPGGIRIGNQSDFGEFVVLRITATSGANVEKEDVKTGEFVDDSYDFITPADLDWKFEIIGILSDGEEREVDIVFVWPENRDDHAGDGIRSGLDTDGDRRANDVDDDDDNDGVPDIRDNCPLIANPDQTNTDRAGDGGDACDNDDDNDGRNDMDDNCPLIANPDQTNTDRAGDGGDACDEDDDNDGVGDEVEAAGCALKADCDNDGAGDEADIDDDGDGLIEVATAVELNAVRYALEGDGRRVLRNGVLNTDGCGGAGSITKCNGYELVTNISLATYADADSGKGWQPLGHDTDGSILGCQGDAFNGTFEGNGWTISDLSISRSGEDCVGLFGHITENSEIRNLRLSAETVIGGNRVGGLVGSGFNSRIHSSSVVAAEVSGTGSNVGGLVGWGQDTRVYSSSVVASEVGGHNSVGSLVGWGQDAQIYSSSVVMGEVRGASGVGGLIGRGYEDARIHSSSVVVGEVSGRSHVGGLMGSFASASGRVAYSYVVSGSDTKMLVGIGGETGVASYWDSETSGFTSSGNLGIAQTTSNLRGPTGYEGIYDKWDDNPVMFDDGSMSDEPLAVWCDRDNSGSIEAGEGIDANLIWDFGTSSQYPAIKCTPISPTEWRDWWFLSASGKPELDRERLNELLP